MKKQKQKENVMYGLVLHNNIDVKKWIKEIGFKNYKYLTKIKLKEKFVFCPPYTSLK